LDVASIATGNSVCAVSGVSGCGTDNFYFQNGSVNKFTSGIELGRNNIITIPGLNLDVATIGDQHYSTLEGATAAANEAANDASNLFIIANDGSRVSFNGIAMFHPAVDNEPSVTFYSSKENVT